MGLTDDRISELEDRLVEFANLNNRENIHFKKLNLRDVWGKHIRPNICAIGVAKSRTRLSDFTFTFHFHASEKEMATHSSVLAWRIPGTGEPGGLPSLVSHRVGYD